MRFSVLVSALGALLCLAQPNPSVAQTAVSPAATPLTETETAAEGVPSSQPPEGLLAPEVIFLSAQAAFALGILLSALALTYGVYQYRQSHRWQRLTFVRQAIQDFEQDPEIRNALRILDFEEYRDYPLPATATEPASSFRASDELLYAALADHKERTREKQALDESRQAGELTADELHRYRIENTLRDWFNKLLNGLEHFGYFVDSGLCTASELKPWLLYWLRLIGDAGCRRDGASKVYDQLYNYIHNYGFSGVQRLFERYGYHILPSPYQDDDFQLQPSEVSQYSTKLGLGLAKAAYLIYQDKQYVAEISRRWGIDIKQDFRYFNNRGRDTQAFMFRSDRFIVLAFRGSQEIRDWSTNFNTRLRRFTLYKAGAVAPSQYQGRVHTGFFLGWNSIEQSVLAQIERWRQQSLQQGKAFPPLFITGHSLGGALAMMAAASLSENGVNVAGLYTFGQPRVGDWTFTRQLNARLQGKIFRFVNNNDIVPHIPPPFSPLNPTHLYGHLGAIKYFNAQGWLVANYKAMNRLWDAFWGVSQGLLTSKFDLINDHRMEYYLAYLKQTLQQEQEDQPTTVTATTPAKPL
jgi:pimeloyl-ACP methyl ester carboxylesterase